jgi:predicted nucleic acid-binding protein
LSSQGYLLDASALIEFILRNAFINRLGDKVLHVLDLTIYESFNALWKLVGRDILTIDEMLILARRVADIIGFMYIESIDPLKALNVLEIALKENLTVYDASYLYIARRMQLILVTEDEELMDRAKKLSIKAINVDEFLRKT